MPDDEFDSGFPDEKAAVDWFMYIRYKGSLVCLHCDARGVEQRPVFTGKEKAQSIPLLPR